MTSNFNSQKTIRKKRTKLTRFIVACFYCGWSHTIVFPLSYIMKIIYNFVDVFKRIIQVKENKLSLHTTDKFISDFKKIRTFQYQNDPLYGIFDYFKTTERVLYDRSGDCDDFSTFSKYHLTHKTDENYIITNSDTFYNYDHYLNSYKVEPLQPINYVWVKQHFVKIIENDIMGHVITIAKLKKNSDRYIQLTTLNKYNDSVDLYDWCELLNGQPVLLTGTWNQIKAYYSKTNDVLLLEIYFSI